MPTPRPSSHEDAQHSLLISLAGVAELARVQRPVPSVWRSRFRTGAHAFPSAVVRRRGSDLFDAGAVAQWLADTRHGNNPEARADAAAWASPADLDFADAGHIAVVEALIALRALGSSELAGADIVELAAEVDPADAFLRSEVERHASRAASWAAYVDALVDASYTPAAASGGVSRRAAQAAGADASAGVLRATAVQLVSGLAAELAGDPGIRLSTGVSGDLLRALIDRAGDDIDLAWSSKGSARALRRRAAALGVPPIDVGPGDGSVTLARVPTSAGETVDDMLLEVENVVLELSERDSAVVLGPARALVDALPEQSERVRADVLRTGRVRAIILLPDGLIASASREALAIWAVGSASERPIAERVTAVADLTDERLTEASVEDLIRDIVVTIDGGRLAAHQYRFARPVRTSSLLARRDGLVEGAARRAVAAVDRRALPALLDEAAARVGDDRPAVTVIADAPAPHAHDVLMGDAVAQRSVRIIPGVRIAPPEIGEAGLAVIGIAELEDPSDVGRRRTEHLTFAALHPNAQLTRPGDVVFCTAPTVRAWVDEQGSHVVVYPARVARISTADPGGLIPELMAADMRRGVGGAGSWRRWRLRTVEPDQRGPLRAALRTAEAARADLERRIADLRRYTDLLADAVSARAVRVVPEDARASATQ